MRTLRVWLTATGGAALLGIVFMGLLHTPLGRTWWSRITGQACPLGFGPQSNETLEARWRAASASLRGAEPARLMPALGFKFHATPRASFEHWVTQEGGHCYERDALSLECADVAFDRLEHSELAGRGTLFVQFGPHQQLREIVALKRVAKADEALAAMHRASQYVTAAVGPPSRSKGELTTSYLEGGALRTTSHEFSYNDYYASLSVTSLSGSGPYSVLQRYRSLQD